MTAVDAYHWPWVGWLLRLTWGNLLASMIWAPLAFGAAGVWAHRKIVRPMHRHHETLHARLDRIEQQGSSRLPS